MTIDKLIHGNKKFKNSKFLKLENTFTDLVQYGQKPKILFIGCSDSRVVPDLIVDSKPGDMFILRNIGNFVPPFKNDHDFHGSSAAIQYAVSVLGVKDIIVCGHSHCGACASLYDDIEENEDFVHVKKWLELGKQAKEDALNKLQPKDKDNKQKLLRLTERLSILRQLENLLSYPAIYKKVKDGTLELHGWYYKIEDGNIEYYDGDIKDFKTLGEE